MREDESPTMRHRGAGNNFVFNKTQEYLSSRGFGWLMEVEEKRGEQTNVEQEQSILEELDIDVKDILWRVKKVVIPFGADQSTQDDLNRVRQPDFWGPFFIVLLYSLLILWGQLQVITWVFLIWIIGSALIYALSILLSDNTQSNEYSQLPQDETERANSPQPSQDISYSQVISFTGYSLLPHVFMVLLTTLLGTLPFMNASMTNFTSVLLKIVACVWSAWSCTRLLIVDGSLQKKKNLILIPLGLLYLYFATMHSGV